MKTCLVTGASGGIGREIAIELSKKGYRVLLQGRNINKLKQVQSELGQYADVIVGDINLMTEREEILDKLNTSDDIDLLVNAAGISSFAAFENTNPSSIAEIMTTNLISPMLFVQSFLKMKNQRNNNYTTTIVNIGSAFGYIGYPGFSIYSASKFGLRGFTESLRREYADSRFKFAYFAPRATQTEINSSQVNNLNQALGNKVDSPAFVAKKFMQFLNKHKQEETIGWPEKFFVRVNSLLPKIVDNAIQSKLPIIKRFMGVHPASTR